MPPHGPQQTLFMGTCVPKSGRKRCGASEALSKFLAVCPQRQPLFFYPPFIPTSSRIGCIEGSGASLSRALVGSLYT